jgi:anti-sigma factor RsiW
MDCQQTQQRLFFYLEKSLDAASTQDISTHLQQCTQCAAQLSKLELSMQLLPAMKQSNPNPFLFTRIEARLQDVSNASQQPAPIFARIFHPILVTVLLAATAFMGYYVVSTTTSAPATESKQDVSIIAGQYEMGLSEQDLMETYYLTEE